MKTRDDIILSMCYTYRHDYGLHKDERDIIGSGVTTDEAVAIWNTMAQIFDNNIAPHMEFKHEQD